MNHHKVKGRLPQYAWKKLVDLQSKFDKLEKLGVFKRLEEINVAVEYLHLSFLVKKGKGGYRLVTAFVDVGRYSKPQQALMPDFDSTLRQIAQWRHIITTDLTSAFYKSLWHHAWKFLLQIEPTLLGTVRSLGLNKDKFKMAT